MTANQAKRKTTGTAPVTAKRQSQAAEDEGERLCPFRTGTKYARIWLGLWRHRQTGVTRKALLEEVTSADKKFADARTCDWAITVVASPTQIGTAHKSVAGKHSDLYWVDKGVGGCMRLRLRDRKT